MTAKAASISVRTVLNFVQFGNPMEDMVFPSASSICRMGGVCNGTSAFMNVK